MREACTSQQNHLKMWSIYWVMPIKHWKHLSACEDQTFVRLQHAWLVWFPEWMHHYCVQICQTVDHWVQEEDSKMGQIIYLWRREENKVNERIGHPLTLLSLESKRIVEIVSYIYCFVSNLWIVHLVMQLWIDCRSSRLNFTDDMKVLGSLLAFVGICFFIY